MKTHLFARAAVVVVSLLVLFAVTHITQHRNHDHGTENEGQSLVRSPRILEGLVNDGRILEDKKGNEANDDEDDDQDDDDDDEDDCIEPWRGCEYVRANCSSADNSLNINYLEFYYCKMEDSRWLGVIVIIIMVAVCFYLLGDTAEDYFSPTLATLSNILGMSPNLAGITFLAFGNGAPDCFSSIASFASGNEKIGLGAIVGAGVFVTTVVTGAVALVSTAKVPARPFIRDVVFYLAAVIALFLIYRDGEVLLWEAACFVAFYVAYVCLVIFGRQLFFHEPSARASVPYIQVSAPLASDISLEPYAADHSANGLRRSLLDVESTSTYMAMALDERRHLFAPGSPSHAHGNRIRSNSLREHLLPAADEEAHPNTSVRFRHTVSHLNVALPSDERSHSMDELHRLDVPAGQGLVGEVRTAMDDDDMSLMTYWEEWKDDWCEKNLREKVFSVTLFPLVLARKLTVPPVDEENWNKLFAALSLPLGTILLLFSAQLFDSEAHPSGHIICAVFVPIAAVLGGIVYCTAPFKSPPRYVGLLCLFAFALSVVWIFLVAEQLVAALAAVAKIIGISPAILGLTIVAWGNSVGDLVANTAIARKGNADMAVTGCFAGPMFNMLIGLGVSLLIATRKVLPNPHPIQTQASLPISFLFLCLSLVSALTIVPFCKFEVRRMYGVWALILYLTYLIINILIETEVVPTPW
eukprot:GILJ01007263.1.p1 GENE.GILJ01007263.1~~GILJ01007263.1.p1  ORF type:complete len:707 (+),score=90.58 GILJ01007263.1:33-2123(+)